MNKSLSTREWLFVILIIVMGLLILHGVSYEFSTSKRALGYVSFAGTIVSILLGLIAIIYSFVQSMTQSNSVVEIKNEVERLVSASNDISQSNVKLHASAKHLEGATEKLTELMGETIGAANKAVQEFQKVPEFYDSLKSDVAVQKNKINGYVTDSTRYWTMVHCVCIYLSARERWSAVKLFNDFVMPFGQKFDMNHEFMCGGITATAIALESDGLLSMEGFSEDDGAYFSIEGDFEQRAKDVFKRLEAVEEEDNIAEKFIEYLNEKEIKI